MSEPPEHPRQTFGRHERLRRPADFQSVYDYRRSAADERLVVYARPNDVPHCRVGLSVSKKKFGRAVARNRMKRLLREAFRLSKAELPVGLDLILIPRTAQVEFPLADLRQSLVRLVGSLEKRLAGETTR